MNPMALVRVAKVVALVGFLAPWFTVSCSGQKIGTASGLSLALGRMTLNNPMSGATETHSGQPVFLLLLAIIAIVAGLVLSFRLAGREGARAVLISSCVAAALVVLGFMGVDSGMKRELAKQSGGNALNSSIAAQIKTDTRWGFWLTFLALLGAGGVGYIQMTGREQLLAGVSNFKLPEFSGDGGSKGDLAFWDGLADKNDVDAMQEYLLRFPNGQFNQLARSKLERAGVPPLAAAATTPATAGPTGEANPAAELIAGESADTPKLEGMTCPRCGETSEPSATFCTACGASL